MGPLLTSAVRPTRTSPTELGQALFKLGLVSLNLGDIQGAKQWFDRGRSSGSSRRQKTDPSSSEGMRSAAILASLP